MFNSVSVGAKVSSYDWVIPYPNATASMAYLQSDGPLPTTMKILDSFFNYLYVLTSLLSILESVDFKLIILLTCFFKKDPVSTAIPLVLFLMKTTSITPLLLLDTVQLLPRLPSRPLLTGLSATPGGPDGVSTATL